MAASPSYKLASPHSPLLPNSLSTSSISYDSMNFQNSLLFLLLISHVSMLRLVSSHCYCHDHQKSALLHLFSTNSTSSLPSWKPHTDCCQWEGITCDPATGHVIAINITHRYISGSINSSAFASLGSLLSLDLSWNSFSSPIPSNISLLSNLTHLNLSNSFFWGQIPAEIGSLDKLVALDVSTNFLYGPLGSLKLENRSIESLLRNLSRLTQLRLDGVDISSPLPKFLSNFTHLTSLRLRNCELVGEFPAEIFLLPKLETLDASGNQQLMGSLPDFPAESALRTLLLSATGFSGSLPYSLGNLSNLSRVELSSCSFHGPIPSSVRKLLRIVHLEIRFNGFGGPLPSLDGLTELQHLDLSYNHFSGQIPSLANLTRLAMLYLSHNHFSGSIPRLDSLKAIREMLLSSNNLSGQIPQFSADGVRNLTVLDLSNNNLHGMVPSYLFSLPSLQKLVLNQNHLDGQLNEVGDASSPLETIDLSYNNLQGQIPRSILEYTSLKVLDLSSNRFNGSVDFVMFQNMRNLWWLGLSDNSLLVNINFADGPSFPHLRKLYLGSCKLTQFPYFLSNQSSMAELDLSNNGIVGEIPNWIWNVASGSLTYLNLSQNSLMSFQEPHNLSSSRLAILDLHSNQLQGKIPHPPNTIVVLDYSENNFTSTISSDFATSLAGAIFFSISGNNVSGEIPSILCKASYLKVLDVSDNQLGGSIPYSCLNLSVLNLRNNHLTGTIPNNSSKKYCILRTLNLNGNQLQGKIPDSLSYCGDLEVLDVGNNRLSGTFPYFLSAVSKLRVLVLCSNNFSGSLYWSFNFSFPELQIIDLSSNNFWGILPAHFAMSLNAMMSAEDGKDAGASPKFIKYNFLSGLYYQDSVMVRSKSLKLKFLKILTIVKSLDLSNNKFEGEIPKEIGALSFLWVLNISNNHLNGLIPESIGNLKLLESLDLSKNQLSGRIPPQLGQLTFLEVLNLSHNQLVGSIPTGPQLQTFSIDSFSGNLQLCGQPLSRKCSPDALFPTSAIEGEESSSSSVNWPLILSEVGYIMGLAILFGSLLLWRKWRIRYFKHVDMLLAYLHERCHFL